MMLNRIVAFVCALAVGSASCLFGQGQESIPDSPYYPLKKDTKWTYQVKGQSTQMTMLTMRVAGYEKVGKDMCAVIETEQDGKPQAKEYIHIDRTGVYRVKLLGQLAEPPVMILKLPPKPKESWKVESKVMGQMAKGTFKVDDEEAQVVVPHGKYKAVVVRGIDFEAAGQKISTTYWFVENMGIVKQEATFGGTKVELELVKFEPPGQPGQ